MDIFNSYFRYIKVPVFEVPILKLKISGKNEQLLKKRKTLFQHTSVFEKKEWKLVDIFLSGKLQMIIRRYLICWLLF